MRMLVRSVTRYDSQYGENIKIHTFVLVSNTALSKYYEKLKESKKDPQKTDENK